MISVNPIKHLYHLTIAVNNLNVLPLADNRGNPMLKNSHLRISYTYLCWLCLRFIKSIESVLILY